jgi:hypothetical protein
MAIGISSALPFRSTLRLHRQCEKDTVIVLYSCSGVSNNLANRITMNESQMTPLPGVILNGASCSLTVMTQRPRHCSRPLTARSPFS